MSPNVSVILPTYNRVSVLRSALDALWRQHAPDGSYEVVVVDNNSADGTADLLASIDDGRLRVIREPRQGLSFARNAGLTAARGAIVAFTDDDVEVAPDWIDTIISLMAAHPEVDAVGGRVLPAWPEDKPSWLTRSHWAPLALQDHGDAVRTFDRETPIGLIGANVAFRRTVFDRIGAFSPAVQRVGNGIGSTEDHELLNRLYGSGGRAMYSPRLVVMTRVPRERCARAYHRRWHTGHGFFHALMRTDEVEQSRRRMFGIPGHLVRSAASDSARWIGCVLRADWDGAFDAELRLRFFGGFLKGRLS
ncbi:MAG TPA: glycosyltransferase [Vicinamibacterales bacterium]|jgi:glycosyltransferase involved in cell wall biosynthesis|nr:glycosyltransferase [Vicinamibacterales bacterium]